tara:strand:- start:2888 stop:3181 length:294 start_codon:yes stop_codon:yes gene_type:complete
MSYSNLNRRIERLVELTNSNILLLENLTKLVSLNKNELGTLSEEFINSKETCEILKCSNVTLWKIRKSGDLPSSQFRNNIRYRKADVLEYLTKTEPK